MRPGQSDHLSTLIRAYLPDTSLLSDLKFGAQVPCFQEGGARLIADSDVDLVPRDRTDARVVIAIFCSKNGPLRGSLLQRTTYHSSGCQKCARGEGHPLWVLTVGYPGGKTRQVSLRPEQVPSVRKAIEEYRDFKQTLEAISELNQFLLRLDREEFKDQERES